MGCYSTRWLWVKGIKAGYHDSVCRAKRLMLLWISWASSAAHRILDFSIMYLWKLVPEDLCFNKLLKILQPPQEFSTVFVDHVFMQEVGCARLYSSNLQVLVKSLPQFFIQITVKKNRQESLVIKLTEENPHTDHYWSSKCSLLEVRPCICSLIFLTF